MGEPPERLCLAGHHEVGELEDGSPRTISDSSVFMQGRYRPDVSIYVWAKLSP